MAWVVVEIRHHMFENNIAIALAEHLNKIGAKRLHIVENDGKNISGVAYVED